MHFSEYNNVLEVCEKYEITAHERVAISEKYPFIFLFLGTKNYEDIDLTKWKTVWFYKKGRAENYKEQILHHKNLDGMYYSVFVFKESRGGITYLGEYELDSSFYGNTENDRANDASCYKFSRINSLDEEKVYFVEKADPIEISELDDRSDVISGVSAENETVLDIEFRDQIVEGTFLDSNHQPIDLSRIMNTEHLLVDIDGIMRVQFNMSEEATAAERRVGQHLFMLSELNASMQLASASREINLDEAKKDVETLLLYTVNVGCGLTNFLVLVSGKAKEVWCFDWGSGRGFTSEAKENIKHCIDGIKNSFFGGEEVCLNKLFISHADSDHYNRIDSEMINEDTEVYVSGYHFVAGRFLNKMNQINSKKPKYIMPICSNSDVNVEILHPKYPIVFGAPTFMGTGFYLAKDKNDVSPIIKIKIKDSTCVFTGDIMDAGWEWFKNDTSCTRIDANVYLHSHHGSVNGFITNIPNIGDCEYKTVNCDIDILSTRDNAYPGKIPSADICSNPNYKKTYVTQQSKEIKYLVTDVLNKTVKKIYR